MRKVFIIKAGITFEETSSLYGDFDKWVKEKLDNQNLEIEVIDIQNNEKLPNYNECAAVIITGSHSMVTDEESWSVKIEKWLPSLIENEVPLLGICYGHQLLAKALGGKSDYHSKGLELGTVDVTLANEAKEDILFKELPSSFKIHTIHSQTAVELPKGSVRLAFNSHDKNHAFRIGSCAWGVQFHPEYDTSIMNSYIKEMGKIKHFKKELVDGYLSKVKKTHIANSILKKFGQIVEEREK